MATMVYGQSGAGIEVPAGRYTTKFLGTEDRDPFKDSKFGKGDIPRMAWVFEVVEGAHKGQKIAQESGCKASPKSTAARIILGLSGGNVAVGKAVDTDQFVGKLYLLKVGPNPNSESGNLHVADLEPVGSPATSSPAARPSAGPPPRRPAIPTTKFWFQLPGKEASLEDFKDVQDFIANQKLDPHKVEVCPEGGSEWRPAAEFGFTDTVPW